MTKPPKGAVFTSIRIGSGGEEIPAFYTSNAASDRVEHVYITLHGRRRDGGHYWRAMTEAIDSRRGKRHTVVIAPLFLSTKLNSGRYADKQLAFADVNAWQAGCRANHPDNTRVSSLDALDAIVDMFADRAAYPRMRNMTVVGHGGGGQLAQRYAAVGREAPAHVHMRYVHGDASTSAYFTGDRPVRREDRPLRREDRPVMRGDRPARRGACELYNTWRYGFDDFWGPKSPMEYFAQYIGRDVVSLVGLGDVEANGDQSCMARLQGGSKRRDRNLAWYKYVNALARTREDLGGFPGDFGGVPDWSAVSNHSSRLRLAAVEDVSHNVEDIFLSDGGQSALFSDGHVEPGWRP